MAGGDPFLTRHDDEFVRDSLRWVVALNNGETIYQDDDREGVEPASAWIRLKEYCTRHGIWIVRMWLQFRSHVVPILPDDAPGYFFVKLAFGVWGDQKSYDAYIAGTLDGDIVRTACYKVPELELMGVSERPANPASPTLIVRHPG